MDRVTTQKQIKTFLNQKPSCSKPAASRQVWRAARAKLRRGISQAKYIYKQRIESTSTPLTPGACGRAYRPSQTLKPPSAGPHPALPPSLMSSTTAMLKGNREVGLKADLPPGELPLSLSTSDVCATLSRVSILKAAGPDGIPGTELRACAVQSSWLGSSRTFSICPLPRQLSLQSSRPPSSCHSTLLLWP